MAATTKARPAAETEMSPTSMASPGRLTTKVADPSEPNPNAYRVSSGEDEVDDGEDLGAPDLGRSADLPAAAVDDGGSGHVAHPEVTCADSVSAFTR